MVKAGFRMTLHFVIFWPWSVTFAELEKLIILQRINILADSVSVLAVNAASLQVLMNEVTNPIREITEGFKFVQRKQFQKKRLAKPNLINPELWDKHHRVDAMTWVDSTTTNIYELGNDLNLCHVHWGRSENANLCFQRGNAKNFHWFCRNPVLDYNRDEACKDPESTNLAIVA